MEYTLEYTLKVTKQKGTPKAYTTKPASAQSCGLLHPPDQQTTTRGNSGEKSDMTAWKHSEDTHLLGEAHGGGNGQQ